MMHAADPAGGDLGHGEGTALGADHAGDTNPAKCANTTQANTTRPNTTQANTAKSASRAPRPGRSGERPGKVVLEPDQIGRALTRIAHEILERTSGAADVVLLGVPTRGVPLARRLAERLEQVEGHPVPSGSLDVTMFRDDLRLRPARALGHTEIPAIGIDGRIVVLVDDVLYSGRTVRAALDALNEIGRPRAVQLAVLVDRGHRELPVRPDYVGKNLPTSQREVVKVLLTEVDGEDAVLLTEGMRARGRDGS
jgi:pyrimidine operon attenuation protein / uracil phosphoribosyltransferase